MSTASNPVPAGPWTWRRVRPAEAPGVNGDHLVMPSGDLRGEALVAADGTWILWSEGGHGTPQVHSPEVRQLLADAYDLRRWREHAGALEALSRELDEARAWARGYESGVFTVDTDNPPEWLIAPLEA